MGSLAVGCDESSFVFAKFVRLIRIMRVMRMLRVVRLVQVVVVTVVLLAAIVLFRFVRCCWFPSWSPYCGC